MSKTSLFVQHKTKYPYFQYPIEFFKEVSNQVQKTYDANMNSIIKNSETIMGIEALHPVDKQKLKEIQDNTKNMITKYAGYDLTIPTVQYVINKDFTEIAKNNDLLGIQKHNEQIKKAKAAYDALQKEGKTASYTMRDFEKSYKDYKAFDPNYDINTNLYDYRDYRKKLLDVAKTSKDFVDTYSYINKYEPGHSFDGVSTIKLENKAQGTTYYMKNDGNGTIVDNAGKEVTDQSIINTLSVVPSDYIYVNEDSKLSINKVIGMMQSALDAEDIRRAAWDLEYIEQNNTDYYNTEIKSKAEALKITPLQYFLFYSTAEAFAFDQNKITNLQTSFEAKLRLEQIKQENKNNKTSSGSSGTKKTKEEREQEEKQQKDAYYNGVTGTLEQGTDYTLDVVPITEIDTDMLDLLLTDESGNIVTDSKKLVPTINNKINMYKDAEFLLTSIKALYSTSNGEEQAFITNQNNEDEIRTALEYIASKNYSSENGKRFSYISRNSPQFNEIKQILKYTEGIDLLNKKDIQDIGSAMMAEDNANEKEIKNIIRQTFTDNMSISEAATALRNLNEKLFNSKMSTEKNIEAAEKIAFALNQFGYTYNKLIDARESASQFKTNSFKRTLYDADKKFFETYILNDYTPQNANTTDQSDVFYQKPNTNVSDRLFTIYESLDYINTSRNILFSPSNFPSVPDLSRNIYNNILAIGNTLNSNNLAVIQKAKGLLQNLMNTQPTDNVLEPTYTDRYIDVDKIKNFLSNRDNLKEGTAENLLYKAIMAGTATSMRTIKAKMQNSFDEHGMNNQEMQEFVSNNLLNNYNAYSALFGTYGRYNPSFKNADGKYYKNTIDLNGEDFKNISFLARYEAETIQNISPVFKGKKTVKKTVIKGGKESVTDEDIDNWEAPINLFNKYNIKISNVSDVTVTNTDTSGNEVVLEKGKKITSNDLSSLDIKIIGIEYIGMIFDGNDWKMTGKLLLEGNSDRAQKIQTFIKDDNGAHPTDIYVTFTDKTDGNTNAIITTFMNQQSPSELNSLFETRLMTGKYNNRDKTYTFEDNGNIINGKTIIVKKDKKNNNYSLQIKDNSTNRYQTFDQNSGSVIYVKNNLYDIADFLSKIIEVDESQKNYTFESIQSTNKNLARTLNTFMSNDFMSKFESGKANGKILTGNQIYSAHTTNSNAYGKYQIMWSHNKNDIIEAARNIKNVDGNLKYQNPDVITPQDFLADTELQDATMKLLIEKLYIKALYKLKKYDFANNFCDIQLLYVIHREGPTGAEDFIRSNGRDWTRENNSDLNEALKNMQSYCD